MENVTALFVIFFYPLFIFDWTLFQRMCVFCVGQKTCMHIHGVFPYLFVSHSSTAVEHFSSYLLEFAVSLDKAINVALGYATSTRQHVYKISLVSGMLVFLV